jgi:hypothetical protein
MIWPSGNLTGTAVAESTEPAESGTDSDVAELAAAISLLRHRLMRRDLLSDPRISAELEQLRQITPGLGHGRHRAVVIRQPVQDAAGYDLKPDPLTAASSRELIAALRKYRKWAGNPSFRAMAAQVSREVAHSTMCAALNGSELPRLTVVMAIVAGCGGGEHDQQAFATAWRFVSALAPADRQDQRIHPPARSVRKMGSARE